MGSCARHQKTRKLVCDYVLPLVHITIFTWDDKKEVKITTQIYIYIIYIYIYDSRLSLGAQSKHFLVKSVFHTFRVVYKLKKKGRGRKRKLALVKTGPGGLADALSVLTDDAVRP